MKISSIINDSNLPLTETEILLSTVLNKDRSFLNSFPETKLTKDQEQKVNNFIKRRSKHEPIPYILGFKEFYGLNFLVNENVLIPRPETENLVERILQFSARQSLTIVDVGTGSGCIAITLAVKNPKLKIIATDFSPQALKVATKNAQLHQVESNIKFIQGDLLEAVNEKIDVIASNLPYIPTERWEKLPIEIRNFEPQLSLDSGRNALVLYQKLFEQANRKLNPNGTIFYEIDGDINQVSAVDLAETPQE